MTRPGSYQAPAPPPPIACTPCSCSAHCVPGAVSRQPSAMKDSFENARDQAARGTGRREFAAAGAGGCLQESRRRCCQSGRAGSRTRCRRRVDLKRASSRRAECQTASTWRQQSRRVERSDLGALWGSTGRSSRVRHCRRRRECASPSRRLRTQEGSANSAEVCNGPPDSRNDCCSTVLPPIDTVSVTISPETESETSAGRDRPP